jgi:hypothetical protein
VTADTVIPEWSTQLSMDPSTESEWREEMATQATHRAVSRALGDFLEMLRDMDPDQAEALYEGVWLVLNRGRDAAIAVCEALRTQTATPEHLTDASMEAALARIVAGSPNLNDEQRVEITDGATAMANLTRESDLYGTIIDRPVIEKRTAEEAGPPPGAPAIVDMLAALTAPLESDELRRLGKTIATVIFSRYGMEWPTIHLPYGELYHLDEMKLRLTTGHKSEPEHYRTQDVQFGELIRLVQWHLYRRAQRAKSG